MLVDANCNVAVIGCGYWGPNLIRNLNAVPNCTMVRVCDADSSRLRHMQSLYPQLETTNDAGQIIHDPEIDAVVIATPVRTHYDLARRCILAGKHVFIEKPMASSVAQCEDLIDLAETADRVLMVGHTFLYSSPVQTIKDFVDSGELGNLLYVSSRRLNLGLFQKDINVAWDLAPHDIAIILHIVGQYPVHVACQGNAHIKDGLEDVTNMTMSFPNGVLAMVQSSWLDPNKIRETTFVGTRRMLVYNDIEPTEKIKIYDKRVEIPPHYDSFAEFHYSYHYGDIHSPYIKMTEPLRVECQHFVDCIQEGRAPLTDGNAGLQVVRVLEAATKSLRSGGGQVALNGRRPAMAAVV